jgi:hypothetical protein
MAETVWPVADFDRHAQQHGRDRTFFHLARVIRLVPEVICASRFPFLALPFPVHRPIQSPRLTKAHPNQDICAKSPIVVTESAPRQSLDSRFPRLPRSALSERRFDREPPTPEEGFEDVGLGDDIAAAKQQQQQQQPQPPKKRGFFKFGSEHNNSSAEGVTGSTGGTTATTTMSRFLPGRKRGQSGQGAELGAMPMPMERPATAVVAEQEVQ